MIEPGATLGVMGGGQLGRMFMHAAQKMGYFAAVLDPDSDSPAGRVAHHHIQTDYMDEQGLTQLTQRCAAVTTEFENVPAAALRRLAAQRVVAPAADSVAVCQDRRLEKAQFVRCGAACAPFAMIETQEQLSGIDAELFPGILKTLRLGYDGKGQSLVNNQSDLPAAWKALGRVPCVLEKRVMLAQEISVIVARDSTARVVHLPVQQNLHRNGILALTQVPAPDVSAALQRLAVTSAEHIVQSLNYVGVLCIEFFVLQDDSLVVNEMAPRPHNSGHYSIDACDVSQFELQVRTLVSAPLAQPRQHSAAVMLNLLGDLWFAHGESAIQPPWGSLLGLPGAHLHLYGKLEPRVGRKMGHLTITAPDFGTARSVAQNAAELLGIAAF